MSKEGYVGSALGLLAIVTVVLQMMYPVIPTLVGWPIVGVLGITAAVLLIRAANIRKSETMVTPEEVPLGVALHPKKYLSWRDRVVIRDIESKMELLHGHSDRRGMEMEVLRGVAMSDLIRMNCTICFRPRNQRDDN